jgi:hypothetical protein
VRIIDGGTPQPPQRFAPPEFILWVAKQLTLVEKVFTCYEAGPFGYSLHRKLKKMEVANYVMRPRDWDEYGKKVKTDKRDAKQLALHLDRYAAEVCPPRSTLYRRIFAPQSPWRRPRWRRRRRRARSAAPQRATLQLLTEWPISFV